MPTWIGAPACGGGGSRVPRPVPQSRRLRVHLPRRDLLQGPRERAGGLPAVVVVNAVRADGHREVLGFDIGDSEDGAFWTAFLRSLNARGLHAVELGISDAHEGLNAAINAVFAGAAWQRCRVHFLRNVPTRVPRGNAEMVAAAIRTIFAQPDAEHVHSQLDMIATMLGRQFPSVETMPDAQEDLLAFACFPVV